MDSSESDIKYGEDFTFVLNGYTLKRHYPVKYCECGDQILATFIEWGGKRNLISNLRFNKKVFCGKSCRSRAVQTKIKVKKDAIKQSKEHVDNYLFPNLKKQLIDYMAVIYVEPI